MASGYINCESCGNKRYIVRAKATQVSPEDREPCKECNFNEWLTWANNYRGYASVKQLTIEELREQFELNYLYQSCTPTIRTEFPKNIHGKYKFSTDQTKWECYQACAKANGILKQ